jgi:hypothetical protein
VIGAVITALIAGVVARILTPGDIFRHMSGPKSWGISLLIGFGGAALGYLIFTVGLGIGDTKVFDFGGDHRRDHRRDHHPVDRRLHRTALPAQESARVTHHADHADRLNQRNAGARDRRRPRVGSQLLPMAPYLCRSPRQAQGTGCRR